VATSRDPEARGPCVVARWTERGSFSTSLVTKTGCLQIRRPSPRAASAAMKVHNDREDAAVVVAGGFEPELGEDRLDMVSTIFGERNSRSRASTAFEDRPWGHREPHTPRHAVSRSDPDPPTR
jgi:hypothetical protein